MLQKADTMSLFKAVAQSIQGSYFGHTYNATANAVLALGDFEQVARAKL